MTRRHHVLVAIALAVLAAGALAVACDLNPQPLPPGEAAGAFPAEDAGTTTSAPGNGGVPADAGVIENTDAPEGVPPVASEGDGGADATTLDGGDGGDGATEDAATDGSGDAPSDAADEGG